tara:strand:- start:75 stop:857 length:783 start_codon:yes stop_codon:yes gene_type:complete
MKYINEISIKEAGFNWLESKPFPHFIVDNFFAPEVAKSLEEEFPNFDSSIWHEYGNAIEIKKTCNNWNVFPELTYKVFTYLNSEAFTKKLSENLFSNMPLFSDFGLNGGGWHIHKQGGKLNTHLDYSVHPKLGLQRKLNIIVYLNSNWKSEWGGSLGLWGNESDAKPGELKKQIQPIFNRAVIFDTTCNSWHGLPEPLACPQDQFRKSLAVYYLTNVSEVADFRGKALFAPTDSQKDDKEILDLIKKRSSKIFAESVYKE